MTDEVTPLKVFQISNVLMTIRSISDLIYMMKMLPQVEMAVQHIFAGGIYIRQITIPQDTFLIGKKHRFDTADIMLSGSMILYAGYGKEPTQLNAPLIFETLAGKQKMGYALTETVWMNCYPTDCKDINDLEKNLYIEEGED